MIKTTLLLAAFALTLCAQTITLTSPTGGEVFHPGDTLYFKYTTDTAYISISSGVWLFISPAKEWWGKVHPLCNSDPDEFKVFPSSPHWGTIPVLIPDSMVATKYDSLADKDIKRVFSTVSDSVKFKIRDYTRSSINSVSGYCSITLKNNPVRPVATPARLAPLHPQTPVTIISLQGRRLGVAPWSQMTRYSSMLPAGVYFIEYRVGKHLHIEPMPSIRK